VHSPRKPTFGIVSQSRGCLFNDYPLIARICRIIRLAFDFGYKGSDEFTTVTLKEIDDHTIEESDRRAGKVVKISLWSIGHDRMTMHVRFDNTQGYEQEQTGHKVQ
jgi:hypothetical protein